MKKFSEMKFVKPKFEKIKKEYEALIKEFNDAKTFLEQDKVLKKVYKYVDHLRTNFTIAEIKYSCDTLSEENQKNQDLIDEMLPNISSLEHNFNLALINSPFKADFEKKYGSHLFKMIETSLECFDEKIIPELQECNKLGSEYTKILASAKIEFQGNTYNLSQIGKFTKSNDRKIRKEASILTAKFFEEHDEEIGNIYDKLVKIRTSMAHKLGFKNYVELGYKMLGRTDYNATDVENYRKQIYEDLVPYTNKLFKEQARRLGLRKPQYYDFNVKFLSGNAEPKGNKDELVASATKMYSELSPDTDTFFRFMQEYELLDLEARTGKAGGGYMTYLPDYKAPFIFSNFNGTSDDVDVLTHEFGHAFQGYMSRNIFPSDYRSPTLEACEMHSMSMEFITYPWMDLFFKDEADKYKYTHAVEAITFIPYGVSVDEFQHWVYENPSATHKERCMKWREIEMKYLPHLKYDEAKVFADGGRWMRQHHIVTAPFYYIDYTLAQIVAFEFFNESRNNQAKAWKKYVKLCKLGGKYPFTGLLKEAHLYNPFVSGTVKKVVKPLKKYLSTFDLEKFN